MSKSKMKKQDAALLTVAAEDIEGYKNDPFWKGLKIADLEKFQDAANWCGSPWRQPLGTEEYLRRIGISERKFQNWIMDERFDYLVTLARCDATWSFFSSALDSPEFQRVMGPLEPRQVRLILGNLCVLLANINSEYKKELYAYVNQEGGNSF